MDETKQLSAKVADLVLLQLANHVPTIVGVAIASRALGASSFGVYSKAVSAAAIVALVVNFGFALTGVRAAAQSPGTGDLSRIFSEVMAAKALLALLCLAAAIAGVLIAQPDVAWFPYAALVLVYGAALALAPTWVFVAIHRVDRLLVPVAVVRLLSVALVAWLVRDPSDLLLYVALTAALEVTLLLWLWQRTHDFGVRLQRPARGAVGAALRGSVPVFGAAAAINLYTASGPLIVGLAIGNEAAGYYGLADRVRLLVLGAIGTVSQAVYPAACRVAAGAESDRSELRKGVRVLLALAVVASVALWVGADLVIRMLGGAGFEPAVGLLRWMAALPLLVTASTIVGNFQLVANGFNAEFTWVASATALLGVPMLYLLSRQLGLSGVG